MCSIGRIIYFFTFSLRKNFTTSGLVHIMIFLKLVSLKIVCFFLAQIDLPIKATNSAANPLKLLIFWDRNFRTSSIIELAQPVPLERASRAECYGKCRFYSTKRNKTEILEH